MDDQATLAYWEQVFAPIPTYDPHKPLSYPALEKGLRWLAEGSPALVDFGCGTGRLLLHLLTLGARRGEGIDLSPQGVALATRVASEHGLAERAHFQAGSVASMAALPTASMEGGILSNILDNLPPEDARRVAEEYLRVLKPGARLLVKLNPFFEPGVLEAQPGMQVLGERFYREPSGLYFWNLTDEQLEGLFQGRFVVQKRVRVEYPEHQTHNRLYYLVEATG